MFESWRFQVAMRYAGSRAGDSLLSFMSFFSVAGLVLGVAVLVLVLSIMNGFERELRLRVLSVLPHAVIYDDAGFADIDSAMQQMLSHPEVLGAAPYVEGSGLIVANNMIKGVAFTGIDPTYEPSVSGLQAHLLQGRFDVLAPGSFGILIGQRLALELNVSVGDKVTLVLPQATITLAGPSPRSKRFQVAGIFESRTDADKSTILMHWGDANKLVGRKLINGIRLKVRDLFEVYHTVPDLMRQLDSPGLYGSTWMHRYGNLYDAIQVQKSTMFFLLLILVAVAAFNVVSNLVMTVNDKMGDIAIMRTMGASRQAILTIFVCHGGMVGVLGVAVGLVVGVCLTLFVSDLYWQLENHFHLGLMDEYFVQYLPTELLVSDLMMIGSVSMVICLLSTIYPAIKAAGSNPVEALQNE